MSNSRIFCDGRRTQAKSPEKSNFVQTCNLLSQYIKEKGSLKDLNVEYGGKLESLESIVKPGSIQAEPTSTTMNLLTNLGKSAQPTTEQRPFVEPLPQLATPDNFINLTEDETMIEAKSSQLIIFYKGKVLVFNDFSEDRAKKLVTFAEKGSAKIQCGILSNTLQEKQNRSEVVASTSTAREGLPPRPPVVNSQNPVQISWNNCKEKAGSSSGVAIASNLRVEEQRVSVSPQSEANGSDLPIARRSSLHRFLAKRKDRSAARGPYHQVQEQPGSSSKGDEQLELKL